jgi:hypothetical protein
VGPFLSCHYAWFLIRSLDFLDLFSNFRLEYLWPLLTRSSLPPGHHKNLVIWVDLSLMAPFSQLSFEGQWPPLMRSSLVSDCPKNHLIWANSIWTVPLDCATFPLRVFLWQFTYIKYCAFIVYSVHDSFQWFLFACLNILSTTVYLLIYVDYQQCCSIVRFPV